MGTEELGPPTINFSVLEATEMPFSRKLSVECFDLQGYVPDFAVLAESGSSTTTHG